MLHLAKDHYYKTMALRPIHEQKTNKQWSSRNSLFERYLNYIFEIPLKQSYEEWLPTGGKSIDRRVHTKHTKRTFYMFRLQARQFFETI